MLGARDLKSSGARDVGSEGGWGIVDFGAARGRSAGMGMETRMGWFFWFTVMSCVGIGRRSLGGAGKSEVGECDL